ncbi:MAG: carboxypeptidase regulatory-like domain-containing protein [Gemmatimonadaceae bacterium]|nr:carboxypeptidase regulatory-like domain-containing protein [Gemmatimonadaceae bacterium]
MLPTTAPAQQLRGTLIRPDSVAPAARVLVEWSAEEATGRLVTDDSGRFTVRLALPGTVRLRVLRPGFRPESLPPQLLARGEVRALTYILRGSSVTLAPMRVEEDRICGPRGEAVAWQLWEQARAVLLSTQIAARDSSLDVEAVQYQANVFGGELDLREESVRRVGLEDPHPPTYYDSLFRFGFIRRSLHSDTTTYHAPTLPVVADERFAERYCFRRVADEARHPDWVGVEFEPARVPGPGIADVTGIFWLDRATLHLREVQYAYVNPPIHHRIDGLGGELRFEELPSGHWILRQWEVRMPRFSGWSSSERRAVGLWAEGRMVSRVRRAGALVYEDPAAEALLRRAAGADR